MSAEDANKRGNQCSALGLIDEAIHHYSGAIKLNPTFTAAYHNRAVAYYEKGNYEAALADYTRAIELNEDPAMAYNNRAFIYKAMQKFDDALADYTHAIQCDPDYATAYYNRACLFKQRNRPAEAVSDYARAVSLTGGKQSTFFEEYKAYLKTMTHKDMLDAIMTLSFDKQIPLLKSALNKATCLGEHVWEEGSSLGRGCLKVISDQLLLLQTPTSLVSSLFFQGKKEASTEIFNPVVHEMHNRL